MSAKTTWIVLTVLLGGMCFWYQHEYKNCINRQMALHLLDTFAFSKSKEICDRKQLLGE